MVPAIHPLLFQRAADGTKLATERSANTVHRRDDHDADAHRNQGILDRGRTGIILEKILQQSAHEKLLAPPTRFFRDLLGIETLECID